MKGGQPIRIPSFGVMWNNLTISVSNFFAYGKKPTKHNSEELTKEQVMTEIGNLPISQHLRQCMLLPIVLDNNTSEFIIQDLPKNILGISNTESTESNITNQKVFYFTISFYWKKYSLILRSNSVGLFLESQELSNVLSLMIFPLIKELMLCESDCLDEIDSFERIQSLSTDELWNFLNTKTKLVDLYYLDFDAEIKIGISRGYAHIKNKSADDSESVEDEDSIEEE
jgi:hypothetical protein